MKNQAKIKQFHAFRMIIPLMYFIIFTNLASATPQPKVLLFSKTVEYHHNSIATGIAAIQRLGAENKFDVDTTIDVKKFNLKNLKHYKAVIFLSTTGDILNNTQQEAFEQYIKSGGGFMGIHAATDCEYDWKWYGNLVGAYFGGHPSQQVARLNIVDQNNISTKHLPNPWIRKDEWYSFKWMAKDLHVLIAIDEKSYNLGEISPMGYHPLAWYHQYDGGRAFYTELGHTEESYTDTLFLKHLLGGIEYAMGVEHSTIEPLVNAGTYQTIYLTKTSTATPRGNGSSGESYRWTDISTDYRNGATITAPVSPVNVITGLKQGTWDYQLAATKESITEKDTVIVRVDYDVAPVNSILLRYLPIAAIASIANIRDDTTVVSRFN